MITCLFALFPLFAPAQNLLMNGGFEDENICTEYTKNCAPEAWISTSLRADYYFDDIKNAHGGQHFVGIIVHSDDYASKPARYLRSRLLCQLHKNGTYRLEFFIRTVHPVLDSIGIYFSADDILYRKNGVKGDTPQLWMKDALHAHASPGWQRISFLYKANGTENFICFGDFKTQAHKLGGQPDLGRDYYFFIDDVSLMPVNKNEKLCANAEDVRREEYAFNYRHGMLERTVYAGQKAPPLLLPEPTTTIIQRIDTLTLSDVLFAVNSYALNDKAYHVLDSFIKKTASFPIDSIVIEGHTDNTGRSDANQTLSKNRSKSVYEYIMPYYKAPIISHYWGSEKPVAENTSAWGRQKNRRVEMYVYVREM